MEGYNQRMKGLQNERRYSQRKHTFSKEDTDQTQYMYDSMCLCVYTHIYVHKNIRNKQQNQELLCKKL